jgi:hypothetical protein
MQDAFGLFEQIRAKASAENDRLAAAHGLKRSHAPIGALNVIHQQATLSAELLSYYLAWLQDPANAPTDVQQRRLESNQRVISLEKSAFVLSVSAIEFSARSAVSDYPDRLPVTGGRIYLRNIIQQSARAGMISHQMELGWAGIIELRNTLVHNGGIAEQPQAFQLPGGPAITFAAGRMMQGNLSLLPEVLLWTTNAFTEWADAFLLRKPAA